MEMTMKRLGLTEIDSMRKKLEGKNYLAQAIVVS